MRLASKQGHAFELKPRPELGTDTRAVGIQRCDASLAFRLSLPRACCNRGGPCPLRCAAALANGGNLLSTPQKPKTGYVWKAMPSSCSIDLSLERRLVGQRSHSSPAFRKKTFLTPKKPKSRYVWKGMPSSCSLDLDME